MKKLFQTNASKCGQRPNHRRGQAAVEMAIAVIASMALIIGSFRIWLWMVTNLVERQEAYQATRLNAARNTTAGCPGGYYKTGSLSVFGETNMRGKKYTCP